MNEIGKSAYNEELDNTSAGQVSDALNLLQEHRLSSIDKRSLIWSLRPYNHKVRLMV